jgi:flagellar biosynthesis/type III secretory pathway M-ring protein FliF/YscJ
VKLSKLKLITKKTWLYAKKFWWAIVLGLLFVVAALIGAVTRKAAFLNVVVGLLESKTAAHDAEIETLEGVHATEVAAKNARLEEHLKRKAELEEEFKERGETLDKQKEAELKRLVDESYNDPEKLAKELAEAFGLKHD